MPEVPEAKNQKNTEPANEKERILGEVKDLQAKIDRLDRARTGYDGNNLYEAYFTQGGAQFRIASEYSNAGRSLKELNKDTPIGTIRDALKSAQQAYDAFEAGMRELGLRKSRTLLQALDDDKEWQKFVEKAMKDGVDPEYVQAVNRQKRILARVVEGGGQTADICTGFNELWARVDRVHREFALRGGRLQELKGPNENILVAPGIRLQRDANSSQLVQLKIDMQMWQPVGGSYVGYLPLAGGSVQSVSKGADPGLYMLWGANGRSMGFTKISAASDAERQQGYGLRITVAADRKQNVYLLKPR